MTKHFITRNYFQQNKLYSYTISYFAFFAYPDFNFILLLSLILVIIFLIVHILKLYTNQKKILISQNKLLNQRIVNIERDYQKLRSDFNQHVKQNLFNEKLISFISHDLRSPMSALLNTSHIFKYYIGKNDFRNLLKASTEIDLTIRNINNMLDNLLHWHLSNTGKIANRPSLINLCEVFDNCTELYEEYARSKSIDFTYGVRDEAYVYADFTMVLESVKNVLCNAIKYSPNYSSIYISISKLENYAKIEIRDEGIGISEHVIESLERDVRFKPVNGTKGEKGFGLGLSVSKKFINECGGSISLSSIKSEGTNVNIMLPLAEKIN